MGDLLAVNLTQSLNHNAGMSLPLTAINLGSVTIRKNYQLTNLLNGLRCSCLFSVLIFSIQKRTRGVLVLLICVQILVHPDCFSHSTTMEV